MSLAKLGKFSKFFEKQLLKCSNRGLYAFISYRDNSKSAEPPYKYVKSKIRVEDERAAYEGGANWELLGPKGNRFFLPNNCGPSWLNSTTTINLSLDCLEQIVDFKSKNPKKLWISARSCPILVKSSLVEIFPVPEVITNEPLTIISLYSNKTFEDGAKDFVLAAREICSRLRMNGYWGDFMNPFSGKPFFAYTSTKELFKFDGRFSVGICVESKSECTIISSDDNRGTEKYELNFGFRGTIFSNILSDLKQIHELIGD